MGKAQSKRSVDITTEVKKDDVIEEGTGKMEKIEDVDQLKPQINGDTHHNDTENTEKTATETEGNENEKDLSTEKEQKSNGENGGGGGDGEDVPASNADDENNKAIENGNDDALNESKVAAAGNAESTTENGGNGDSSKKLKKEKVKKKWSFRNISFGKKDKQKPTKKDEGGGAVNGECEKVPEESTEESAPATENIETKPDENAPQVEKSDVPTPTEAEKTEKKVEVAAVTPTPEAAVNGSTTEPIPAVEKTQDNVTPPEEKKPEAVETTPAAKDETPKKIEIVAEPQPKPASDVTTKTNETEKPAATKIEVKAEKSVQESKKKDARNKKVKQHEKIDGDSESAQNLPPPPLPCNPPPSQVMVFALGDDKAPDQEIQAQLPATEVKPEETVSSASVETPAVESDKKSEEKLVESVIAPPVTSEKPKVAESPVEEPKPSSDQSKEAENVEIKTETQSTVENVSSNVSEEKQVVAEEPIKKETVQSSETVPEKAEEKKVESVPDKGDAGNVNATVETSKPEAEIKPEQIAETLALIDEVTKEAVSISQQRLEEKNAEVNVAASAEGDKTQLTEEQQTVPENSSTASPLPEDKSLPPITAPENISTNTEAPQDTLIPSEKSVPTPPTEDKSDAIEKKTESVEQAKPQRDTVAPAPPALAEIAANTKEDVKTPSDNVPVVVDSQEKKVETEQNKTVTDSKKDDKQPDSKLKENGIGENHEQPAETSATESLNGHKTVEEIKAEHTEKSAAEVTPDNKAAAVPVSE